MCTTHSGKSRSQIFTYRLREKGHGNENLRANQGFLLTIVFFDRNLLYSLDENKVRPQDSLYWIEMVNKGSGKTDASWDFIVKHWKNIARRWREKSIVKSTVGCLTSHYFSLARCINCAMFCKVSNPSWMGWVGGIRLRVLSKWILMRVFLSCMLLKWQRVFEAGYIPEDMNTGIFVCCVFTIKRCSCSHLDMGEVTSLAILLKQWLEVFTRQTSWKWQVHRTVFSLVEELTFLFKSCWGFLKLKSTLELKFHYLKHARNGNSCKEQKFVKEMNL